MPRGHLFSGAIDKTANEAAIACEESVQGKRKWADCTLDLKMVLMILFKLTVLSRTRR